MAGGFTRGLFGWVLRWMEGTAEDLNLTHRSRGDKALSHEIVTAQSLADEISVGKALSHETIISQGD